MALIVEDGSGMADAESYSSVADTDTYHAKRGNTVWDSAEDKEACLRKAADYMTQQYRKRWKGVRSSTSQALDFPRGGVELDPVGFYPGGINYLPNNVVPSEVKQAQMELALRVAAGDDLSPDLERGVLSESVGPISVTYDPNSPQQKRFRAVDSILSILLEGNTANVKVMR